MPTIYNSFKDLPNRRGEYLVNAQFADKKEICNVCISFDVNEETGIDIESAYAFVVTSKNQEHCFAACFGLSSVANTIAECEARLKTIL